MQDISILKNSFQYSAYKKHFHNTYSISLITDGECHIKIEDREYIAIKGDMRIINPYEIHEILNSSWEHINLVISSYLICSIFKQHKKIAARFQNIINDKKLSSGIETLYEQKELQNLKIKEILEYMVKRYSCEYLKKSSLHIERLKLHKALFYIDQNANSCEINLDVIASYIGLSKYHFLREFKKEFGLTPYQYMQNIKINNARVLLHAKIPLSQIALECGFFDQSHLIKTYKKFFGHTPSKVLKQQ